MKIKVTQEHIDRGISLHCTQCPIALAIKNITEGHVEACQSFIRIGREGSPISAPKEVMDFINLFDNPTSRHLAQPFEFELPI